MSYGHVYQVVQHGIYARRDAIIYLTCKTSCRSSSARHLALNVVNIKCWMPPLWKDWFMAQHGRAWPQEVHEGTMLGRYGYSLPKSYIWLVPHTYIHAYIHSCMHACVRTYINTYIHTYTHMHAWMHAYIPTYLPPCHIHTHTCMHACVHTYIPTYLPTYMCVHIPWTYFEWRARGSYVDR